MARFIDQQVQIQYQIITKPIQYCNATIATPILSFKKGDMMQEVFLQAFNYHYNYNNH